MDSKMMAEKLVKMAWMMGWSPETIDKLKNEIVSKQAPQEEQSNQSNQPKWATVIVASVKKDTQDKSNSESEYCDKLCAMDDKAIDNLSDKDAKDLLKSVRDEMKKEEWDEESSKKWEDSPMDFQTMMNKTGTMF